MLRVPLDRLPVAPLERHAALRSYFCDKDAEALDDGSGWSLELSWPDGHERHVDPRLDEGLAWWGEGVTRSSMAMTSRRDGRILSALYDTWTRSEERRVGQAWVSTCRSSWSPYLYTTKYLNSTYNS